MLTFVDLNATQAAIRAGYKVDNAQQVGSENLSKLVIREAIDKALAERSRRTGGGIGRSGSKNLFPDGVGRIKRT